MVRFGATVLLRDVSFTVGAGERWGIVGRNGAGKTTLFRLIAGTQTATAGIVSRAESVRVAMLDQHREFGRALTVWDAAAAGYAEAMALEAELARLGERLAELGEGVTEADLTRYGRVQDRFAHAGGYDFHARVDAVLQGLGFDPEESKTRPLASLSGGERGRVGLAAPLAAPADLLLPDEPTNHLDLETTRWLTRWITQLDETVLVISHDRAFLDETVDHVLHVAHGTADAYRGGYTAFASQRAEQEIARRRAYEKQQAFIEKEEDYIRRNIAGQNTAQAKGRRTRLARLPRLSPLPGEAGAMSLRLETAERSGEQVVQTERLRVAVGDRVLLDGMTVTARRTDVIALIGPNGAGKSTLLATLLGAREPDTGTVKIGASVTPAWYRQDLTGVPLDVPVYDVIHDLRPAWNRGQIQGHLGAFGFSGDEVLRITTSLSGGERARVALAMITLSRANLLVLDEPTNHLDVESIEAVEDAIEEYDGTVILVSHDRAFLRELATRVWWIDGTRLRDFQGTFVGWEAAEEERTRAIASQDAASKEVKRAAGRARVRSAAPSRPAPPPGRAVERRVEEAEREVARLEARVVELTAALAEGSLYDGSAEGVRRAATLGRELEGVRAELETALTEWSSAAGGGE
jgi:ATP-binding cassette subfamily F protein 3